MLRERQKWSRKAGSSTDGLRRERSSARSGYLVWSRSHDWLFIHVSHWSHDLVCALCSCMHSRILGHRASTLHATVRLKFTQIQDRCARSPRPLLRLIEDCWQVTSSVSSGIVVASASAGPLLFFLILRAGARREQDASLVSLSPAGEGRRSTPHVRGLLPELCSQLARDGGLAEAVRERAALRTTFASVSRAPVTQDEVTNCTHEGALCERGCEPAGRSRRWRAAPLRPRLLLPGCRRLLRAP